MKLPTGLSQLWQALAPSGDAMDRAITLIFLRQLLDPTMPTIAGQDPRRVVSMAPPWNLVAADGNRACWLDALAERVNELLREPLLTAGWETKPPSLTEQAVAGVTAWATEPAITGGDTLGAALELLRPGKAAHGAFYTPYTVCYAMAKITEPQPGESVCDPACGSGRMLLAALHACREAHDGGEPVLYGVDIDPDAVRVCKLNLILAGYGMAKVEQAESPAGKKMLSAAGRSTSTNGHEPALTKAQQRILAEVRENGAQEYDGRARKSIQVLERAGLVNASRQPAAETTGARRAERIIVRAASGD